MKWRMALITDKKYGVSRTEYYLVQHTYWQLWLSELKKTTEESNQIIFIQSSFPKASNFWIQYIRHYKHYLHWWFKFLWVNSENHKLQRLLASLYFYRIQSEKYLLGCGFLYPSKDYRGPLPPPISSPSRYCLSSSPLSKFNFDIRGLLLIFTRWKVGS